MSFSELDITPPKPQPSPRQFTLSGLLRLFVVIGIICATAVWFENLGVALSLAVATCVLYFLTWARLPRTRRGYCEFLAAAVVLVWTVTYAVSFLTGLALFLPASLFLARARFGYLVLFVLLSPLGTSFAGGIWDYSQGQAVMMTEGYTQGDPALDPKTRCYWQSSGCIAWGHEWALHGPNNAAVRVMTSLFGYMRGAYTGPYPTEAEAATALKTATNVSWDDFLAGRLDLPGEVIQIEIPSHVKSAYDLLTRHNRPSAEPTVKVWREECIILQIPSIPPISTAGEGFPSQIFLISRRAAQVLTMYDAQEKMP